MLLMIDNYDSFTFNLVQYFGELGVAVKVLRNDQTHIDEIESLSPEWIVISPGPCSPKQAGISVDVIRAFAGKVPLFGVCLGHQCIGHAFGGVVTYAKRLMHGKTSPILHESQGVFRALPTPFTATRYHSLAVQRETLPDCLEVLPRLKTAKLWGYGIARCPSRGFNFTLSPS